MDNHATWATAEQPQTWVTLQLRPRSLHAREAPQGEQGLHGWPVNNCKMCVHHLALVVRDRTQALKMAMSGPTINMIPPVALPNRACTRSGHTLIRFWRLEFFSPER